METRDLQNFKERLEILKSTNPVSVTDLEALKDKSLELAQETIESLEVLLNLFKSDDLLRLSWELERLNSKELEQVFGPVSDFYGYGGSLDG